VKKVKKHCVKETMSGSTTEKISERASYVENGLDRSSTGQIIRSRLVRRNVHISLNIATPGRRKERWGGERR